jgi:signal transduction histidine kinase
MTKASSINLIVHIGEINEVVPKEWHIHLYRIVQECMHYIIKQADAKEHRLSVLLKEPNIVIEVFDDGDRSIKTNEQKRSHQHRSVELNSMSEHIRILGGTLQLHSISGKGTELRIEIPLRGYLHE